MAGRAGELTGVPPSVEPRVKTALQYLDSLSPPRKRKDRGGNSTLLMPSGHPTVISILGDQGVGKSTTLKYICDSAEEDPKRLVLPICSPERFAEGDTLFGWVLSALTEFLPERLPKTAKREAPSYRQGLSMSELADLLRRQEALARRRHLASVSIGSAHPDEWAESIAAVTTAGLQLMRGWSALLEGMAKDVKQIVIPVDDADQVPSLLASVLRDLRWLTLDPLVAVVLCANEDMLHESLLGEQELSMMDPIPRRRHVVGVLTKALPHHLRLAVSPLQPPERLGFKPEDKTESMITMLKRFDIPGALPIEPQSIGELFELKLGKNVTASLYADLLPGAPRELDQLWRELEDLDRSKFENKAGLVARKLVESALERATGRVSGLPQDSIRIFESDSEGLSAAFDFSEIKPGWSVGTGRSVFRDNERSVAMRRVEDFPLHPVPVEEGVAPGPFPADFAAVHYFAMDLTDPNGTDRTPFYLWGYVRGGLALPGGSSWLGTVEVDFRNRPTDNSFALVPDWEGHYDYLLFAAGWNSTWVTLREVSPDRSPALVEWVLLRHLRLVIDVQRNRSISPALLGSARAQLEDLDGNWDREAEFRAVTKGFKELYRPVGTTTIRESDFREWVGVYAPALADPILGLPDFARRLLEARGEVARAHGDLDRYNQRCAQFLAARVRRNLSADWVTHTIDLVRGFDPPLAERLTELHEVASEEKDSDLEAIAATLEERGIPREVVGELFLKGVSPQLKEKLAAAGLPEAAIEILALRFGGAPERDRPALEEPHPERGLRSEG